MSFSTFAMFFFDSDADFNKMDRASQIQRFRTNANRLVDFVCDYTETISRKPVSPGVEPGFMRPNFAGIWFLYGERAGAFHIQGLVRSGGSKRTGELPKNAGRFREEGDARDFALAPPRQLRLLWKRQWALERLGRHADRILRRSRIFLGMKTC